MQEMTVLSKAKLITGEELLAMGDIGPCELIDGRIVPMSPTGGEHAYIEFYLGSEISNFVQPKKLGWVLGGEVGIYTRRQPDRVRGADVAFISKNRSPRRPTRGFLEVAPELVVEIMSPDDRWQDVQQKLEEYFSIGVEWVWIVEPENRAIYVYRSGTEAQKFGEDDIIQGEGVLAGFSLSVANLFSE
ncbi:MAG: restriction endonuclease [Chloroflexota bacterium]|nr:MAG: restriction endonuclease [Chloroflexota bacterium]